MAWTDSCRFEAVTQIDRRMAQGLSKRAALKAVSNESDIPTGTLNRWKYGKKTGFKNEPKEKKSRKPPAKKASEKTLKSISWDNAVIKLREVSLLIRKNSKKFNELDEKLQIRFLTEYSHLADARAEKLPEQIIDKKGDINFFK